MVFVNTMRMSERTKNVVANALGAYGVKGASLIVSFFTLPAYIAYFDNESALGVWYTILSIINWFNLFDFGIGNGLRNSLTQSLAKGDMRQAKTDVSSAYVAAGLIALVAYIMLFVAEGFVPWNDFLNIGEEVVSAADLVLSMRVVTAGILIRIVVGLVTYVLYAMQRSAMVNACSLASSVLMLSYVVLVPAGATSGENMVALSFVHVIAINAPAAILTFPVFRKLKECRPSIRWAKLDCAKRVMSVGLVLMWLTLVGNVVFQLHSILISAFLSPDVVTEYQAYYKVFNTISSLLTLALVPVWSAVTKAQAEGDWRWCLRLHSMALAAMVGVLLLELVVAAVLQPFFDAWLGAGTFTVRPECVAVMIVYGLLCTLHSVNTTFDNGLERLRLQTVLVTAAALLMLPLSWALAKATGDWVSVVVGSTLAILPYEIAAPIAMRRYLLRGGNGNLAGGTVK